MAAGVRRVAEITLITIEALLGGSKASLMYMVKVLLRLTQRFALEAIFVYQLTLWYRFEHNLDLRVGLKAFLKAA